MNRIRLIAAVLLAIILNLPCESMGFFSGGTPAVQNSISEMADMMAGELRKDYPGTKLYLSREDIRDEQDGTNSPFSSHLANELERALSRAGFAFEDRYIDRADSSLTASYRKTADIITVYLKIRDIKNGSAYRSLKGSYLIRLDRLPPDSFADSLESRISRMATKLSRGWRRTTELSVFVTPVLEARKKYSSPFSEYVTRKIKTLLPGEHTMRVIEEKPAMQKLTATRSLKAIKTSIETSDAAVVGADAVLEGSYLTGRDGVSLSLTLKDLKGAVIESAEDSIPFNLVRYSVENDAAEAVSRIADTEHESGGQIVRISTTKGGGHQVFHEGEIVTFRLQVARPLYIYVYGINPKGEVNLLYPRPGEVESPKFPGIIHLLPDENDSWAIKVEPPFGTDAVKVFASNQKLPLPRISDTVASLSFEGNVRSLKRVDKTQKMLASSPAINSLDLVDYYKGVAHSSGATLFESTVYVETRRKQKN